MNIPSPRANRRARIEIIPLIDIIFFLLATFVMVSLSMVKSNAVAVNLPAASTSEMRETSDHASITVTEEGDIFWNKERDTLAGLAMRLEHHKASNSDPKVVFHGDALARYGDVVTVLDAVRSAGIAKLSIETRPLPKAVVSSP